jgi:hypothetical protein
VRHAPHEVPPLPGHRAADAKYKFEFDDSKKASPEIVTCLGSTF